MKQELKKQPTIREERIDNWKQDWVEEEIDKMEADKKDRTPSLKLEELKIKEVEIDFTIKWEQWIDKDDGKVKTLIPVIDYSDNKQYTWWLNIKNPIYLKILKSFSTTGKTVFKIMQIGNGKDTKYELVE